MDVCMAQTQQIVRLLMRYVNDVAAKLSEVSEEYEPLLLENPNDGIPLAIVDEGAQARRVNRIDGP